MSYSLVFVIRFTESRIFQINCCVKTVLNTAYSPHEAPPVVIGWLLLFSLLSTGAASYFAKVESGVAFAFVCGDWSCILTAASLDIKLQSKREINLTNECLGVKAALAICSHIGSNAATATILVIRAQVHFLLPQCRPGNFQ